MKQSLRRLIIILIFFFVSEEAFSQKFSTLTDSLVNKFHDAWNNNDLKEMGKMLQPDAFFKSPHQLRYSADTMKATVLIINPPRIKDCWSKELYSKVDSNIAWSIGELYCNTYDDNEKIIVRAEDKSTEYTYIFTRKKNEEWKLQILCYHE